MSKILVTGGAGFIGSHIVDQLIEEGHEVVVYDNLLRGKLQNVNTKARFVKGDILYLGELLAQMEGVDYVFHQAALCLKDCEEDPYWAMEINIRGTLNVLEACRRQGIKKLIAASSSSVYGDGRYLPTDEEHPFDNYLFYGATKVANEQFYRAYYKKYGLNYVAFRYLNVYGPRMDTKGAYVAVVMRFIDQIKRGEQPVINGDGSATMDMIYVDDVARLNILAMKSDVTNEVFNGATGKGTSVKELLDIISKQLNKKVNPIFQQRDNTLVTHRLGCPKKAEKMLGFKAEVGVEEGVRRIIDQYNSSTI